MKLIFVIKVPGGKNFSPAFQSDLAEKLGVSYPRVNELIHGKRGITPDTALRPEKPFGMEAQFWLNLQSAWDLYHATRALTANEIKKIKRLPALAHVKTISA